MKTELGFHRALHSVDRCAEDHGVEFLDQLAWTEGTQVAAITAGRAGGVGFGDFSEVSAAFDLSFQFVALGFGGNQDVAGSGFGHGEILHSTYNKVLSLPDSAGYFSPKFGDRTCCQCATSEPGGWTCASGHYKPRFLRRSAC